MENKNRKNLNENVLSMSTENLSKRHDDYEKPDGGYGWIILLSAFFISFILDGCMYSFGIVLNEIKNHYKATQDVANLVASLNTGFLFLSGPISSALANQFGCRPVVMGASAIFALMYFVSAFLPNIYLMVFFFGVIGGIAFGCSYLTCFIILVDYFDKKLGIANGLTMAGSGLGAFAFAPFTQFLVEKFGWKLTMIILSALTLHCCIFGALLKPLDKKKLNKNKASEMETLNGKLPNEPEEEEKEKENKLAKTVKVIKEVIKDATNFKILMTNKLFLLITLSNAFIFLVYFIPFIYIPVRAKELGITQYAWIISIIGIVNIPARITFGFICDRNLISAINMNTLCKFFATLSVLSYFYLEKFWEQSIFAFVFAISIAGLNCLATMYLVDIVGPLKFANANGIMNMFRGFGCIIGPYIGGYLSEVTKTTFYSFLFAGLSFLVAFLLSFLVSIFKFIKKRRANNKNNEPNEEESEQ